MKEHRAERAISCYDGPSIPGNPVDNIHIPETSLRSILDAIPDGIGVESEGRIVWANKGFARLYGYNTPEELLGRSLDDFVTPEDRERLMHYTRRRWQGEPAPESYRFRGLKSDDSVVEVEISVSSFTVGDRLFVLGALRDLSERVMLARRLEAAQRLEALGTLARGISHDFNNLLGGILGNIEVAQLAIEQGRDPSAHLERVRLSVERGELLTRQLQAFTGHARWQGQTPQPARIVKDTLDLLGHAVTQGVQLVNECPEDLPAVDMAPGQFQQILMNLLTNAIDAMPEGGRLYVRGQVGSFHQEGHADLPRAEYLCFQIEDTGIGIRNSELSRIYEPFFTTKAPDRGTGLGLSVVFGALRTHGGWIDVQSELGKGTCFTFWLARAQEPAESVPEQDPDLDTRAHPGETVLVVDDDPALRGVLQDVLENKGYKVITGANGLDAVALDDSVLASVHLLVIDLVMPQMDGVECALELLRRRSDLGIILCTGLIQDDRVQLLPSSNLRGVLRKPVTAQRLLSAVRRSLDWLARQV